MYSEINIKLVRDESENKSFISIGGNTKNMPPEKKKEFIDTVTKAVCMVFGIDTEDASGDESVFEKTAGQNAESNIKTPPETKTALPELSKPSKGSSDEQTKISDTSNASNEDFTKETAFNTKVVFGSFKKNPITIKELIEKHPESFDWLLNKYHISKQGNRPNDKTKRAAEFLHQIGVA